MKKKHHKKNKETIQPKENIQELSASRDGGQVAEPKFPVGDIAEELWAYSKSVELLIEPEDEDYLERQRQIIRENVRKMLDSLKNKISSDDIDWLTEICDEVFEGKRFVDEDFNSLIEDFNRSWEET